MAMPHRERLLPPQAHAYFDPARDRVERRNGRLYIVDTKGEYAPVEVLDQETPGLPIFQANVQKMTRANEIATWWFRVKADPYLSDQGKQERGAILRARWRELFGDAVFVVDPD